MSCVLRWRSLQQPVSDGYVFRHHLGLSLEFRFSCSSPEMGQRLCFSDPLVWDHTLSPKALPKPAVINCVIVSCKRARSCFQFGSKGRTPSISGKGAREAFP